MPVSVRQLLLRRQIDWRDPLAAFASVADQPFAHLRRDPAAGRAAILLDPVERLEIAAPTPALFARLRAFAAPLDGWEADAGADWPGGGLVAALSYEAGLVGQGLAAPGKPAWPALIAALYDQTICFDDGTKVAWAQIWVRPGETGDQAQARLAALSARLTASRLHDAQTPPIGQWREMESDEAIARLVETARARIEAGDFYQLNLSRLYSGTLAAPGDPFALFAQLADQAGAFSAFWRWGDRALLSISPEMLLSVRPEASWLIARTRPIKGTRPRGADPRLDAQMRAELLASEKEQAENRMIVDLMRNDLARVAAPGGISVPRLFDIETLPYVHHLVSEVRAQLRGAADALDALEASFPAGSITGAPKRAAMQAIADLEAAERGPFCGSLVWLSPGQQLDASVLIRTAGAHRQANGAWRLGLRVGAGIVADSDPLAEAVEMRVKARPFLNGLAPEKDGQC